MTTTVKYLMSIKEQAPLSKATREQLKKDIADLPATAKRKGLTLDRWEQASETRAAKKHFELGCWLHYYSTRVGIPGELGLAARVDCARRIFMAGIKNPGYDFMTVFDFGERDFDTIFESGDSKQVIDRLRQLANEDSSGNIAEAFEYFGWSIERKAQPMRQRG